MTRLEKLRRRLHKRKANRERKRRHHQGFRAKREARVVRRIREAIRALLRRGPLVMYDDTSVGLIPSDAKAVAGYVNGNYATWPDVLRLFPHARHVSIAVTSGVVADCLDVEPGDAANADAPGWYRAFKRAAAKNKQPHRKPIFYTSTSNADALVAELATHGVARHEYKLWLAHYGDGKHICGPDTCGLCRCKADGTQWTSTSHGRSLDESYLRPHFL